MNKPKKTARNYRSASTPATLRKQAAIRDLLRFVGEGLTVVECAKALGVSRQLCLYHLKKMAATGQVVMMLEPCQDNGGVRYRVWDEMALAAYYARMMPALVAAEARRAA